MEELSDNCKRLHRAIIVLIYTEKLSLLNWRLELKSHLNITATNLSRILNDDPRYLTAKFLQRFNKSYDNILTKLYPDKFV